MSVFEFYLNVVFAEIIEKRNSLNTPEA